MITAAEAVASALASAGLAGAEATEPALVERLDGGDPYFLVTMRTASGAGGMAIVDALTAEVTGSARLVEVARHALPNWAQAVALAGCPADAGARLVWRPSRATRSPFYPLCELTWDTGRAFVDMQGGVWASPDERRS